MTAPESFAGNTQGDPEWEVYMHTADAGLEVRVPVKAGTREVGVSFVRNHWEPEGVLQPPQRGFARTTNELYHGNPARRERSLIGGPYQRGRRRRHAEPPQGLRLPAAAARPKRPARSRFSRRSRAAPTAGRSTDEDVADAARLLQGRPRRGRLRSRHPAGSRTDPGAPSFLFRVEREPAERRAGHAYRLSDLDLASRLSFFLWSSIPDDELLDLAVARKAQGSGGARAAGAADARAIRARRRWSTISPTSG